MRDAEPRPHRTAVATARAVSAGLVPLQLRQSDDRDFSSDSDALRLARLDMSSAAAQGSVDTRPRTSAANESDKVICRWWDFSTGAQFEKRVCMPTSVWIERHRSRERAGDDFDTFRSRMEASSYGPQSSDTTPAVGPQ